MPLQPAASSSRGFTLIELMVVVVIATILLSIAVPSYMSQIRQSRRTEAKTAILDLSGREERYLSTNPAGYTNTPASLGYVGFGVGNPIGNGYYYLTVCSPATATCVPGLNMPNPPAAPSTRSSRARSQDRARSRIYSASCWRSTPPVSSTRWTATATTRPNTAGLISQHCLPNRPRTPTSPFAKPDHPVSLGG